MVLLYLLAGVACYCLLKHCNDRDWSVVGSAAGVGLLFFTMMVIKCLSDMRLFETP